MAEPLKIALLGATGLVGRTLMEELVGRADFRLTAIARREVPLPAGACMEMRLADPSHWGEILGQVQPDVVVCALGTTLAKAGGDRQAFRAVDHDLVLQVASAAQATGARQFIYVSSVGASLASKSFYLQVKGEVENALAKLRFKRLDILQPGLLRGNRQGETRVAEGLGRLASPLTDMLLHGSLRRYRSIPAKLVAQAMLGLAQEKAGGRFVHEHDAMLRAARRFSAKDHD